MRISFNSEYGLLLCLLREQIQDLLDLKDLLSYLGHFLAPAVEATTPFQVPRLRLAQLLVSSPPRP